MFDENCFFSRGAPAAQSGACNPGPRWAGGLQPRARAARPPTPPGGQGGPGRTPEQSLHPLPPVGGGLRPCVRAALVPPAPGWQEGSSSAPERGRNPGPRIPFWNLNTLKCKENVYLDQMNINQEGARAPL